jgi:hypothetical protein
MKKLFSVLATVIFCFSIGVGNVMADDTTANASVDVSANAGINEAGTIKDSFNSGPGKRGLPIGNQATFIPPASFFGPNEEGHQFFPLKTLLHFKDCWTIDEAEKMVSKKRGGKDVEIRPITVKAKDASDVLAVRCVLETPTVDYSLVGFGAIAAKDDGSITPDVFARAIIEAEKLGANVIQFLAEGKNVRLTATGWGINLNGGVSVIRGDNDTDGAGGGGGFAGTGYSSYESGYVNMPWLQMAFLTVAE